MELLATYLGPVGIGLTVVVSMVALVLVAGLLAGQFRRGVVEELRGSLSTANDEIAIERGRSDRLEREAQALRLEVRALRAEVQTLRTVLVDERKIAQTVAEALKQDHELSTDRAVSEIVQVVGQSTARIFEKIDQCLIEKKGTP